MKSTFRQSRLEHYFKSGVKRGRDDLIPAQTVSAQPQPAAPKRRSASPAMSRTPNSQPNKTYCAKDAREDLGNLRYGQLSVILPWSTRNRFRDEEAAWPLIAQLLQSDRSSNSKQLRGLLQSLLVHLELDEAKRLFNFNAICYVVDHMLSPAEQGAFFKDVLPWLKSVVLSAPKVFGDKRVPLLRQGKNEVIQFSHNETVILLASAFFSLYPGRSQRGYFTFSGKGDFWGISKKVANFNFDSFFSAGFVTPQSDRQLSNLAKVRCVLQFFMTAYELHHSHNDCHFEVSRVSYAQFPDFRNSRTPLGPFELLKSGFIENDVESLQVDFANKVIGGGVLGAGCVQEEVRFVISPQLLLSRLVCEVLLDNEAVLLSGAAQYSDYIGYASSFRFQDRRHPGTILSGVPTTTDLPRGNGKIQDICVVAVDAINFSGNVEDQYLASYILREVRKAFVGFHGPSAEKATCKLGNSGPIATGNWGCGAFGGDVELKVLIQWIAASEAKRPVRYYVFDRKDLLDSFPPVLAKLTNEKWSVGDLFLCLVLYFSNVSAGLNSATQTVSQYILATNIDELRELE